MSEAAAVLTTPTPVPQDKRPQVETLLTDVFRLMEYPAKLEFKDMPDGSLGVAVHFEGELPGITPGKRSYLLDCVQFWLNKVVNRPNVPRRWVNLGVDSFPEPRAPGSPVMSREAAPQPAPAAPVQKQAQKPQVPPQQQKKHEKHEKHETPANGAHSHQQRKKDVDERTLAAPADPRMSAVGKLLAEKSAKHGRLYGVMLLNPEARSLMLKAADEVKGVKAKAEGEGHWRRLVMVPDNLTVISKKQVMPDYDDDEEDE